MIVQLKICLYSRQIEMKNKIEGGAFSLDTPLIVDTILEAWDLFR